MCSGTIEIIRHRKAPDQRRYLVAKSLTDGRVRVDRFPRLAVIIFSLLTGWEYFYESKGIGKEDVSAVQDHPPPRKGEGYLR